MSQTLTCLENFLHELSVAALRGYEFQTSRLYYEEKSLTTGLFVGRLRWPILCGRPELRALDPLEAVCHSWMVQKLIPAVRVVHPLIAAEKLGMPQVLATRLWAAACWSPEGFEGKLRASLCQACNVPVDV